ncbi:hypothetical protein ACIP01_11095 [Pseudomonas monteilii]|uniref:hypothetical protein n=1 Tax=Pseudomonas monteilii TaxID=76759 RepID=UPI003813F98C
MIRNFTISNGIYLEMGGAFYDIHNFFDVAAIQYLPLRGVLSIEFTGSATYPSENTTITLEFRNIFRIISSPKIFNLAEPCFSEFGFKDQSDFDHDWLVGEDKSSPTDDIFLRFSGDDFIRVNCQSIHASVKISQVTPHSK